MTRYLNLRRSIFWLLRNSLSAESLSCSSCSRFRSASSSSCSFRSRASSSRRLRSASSRFRFSSSSSKLGRVGGLGYLPSILVSWRCRSEANVSVTNSPTGSVDPLSRASREFSQEFAAGHCGVFMLLVTSATTLLEPHFESDFILETTLLKRKDPPGGASCRRLRRSTPLFSL